MQTCNFWLVSFIQFILILKALKSSFSITFQVHLSSCLDACFIVFIFKVGKHEHYRFSFIVNELKTTEVIAYKRNLMAFINCILFATDELYERIKIRVEFTGKLHAIIAYSNFQNALYLDFRHFYKNIS